MNRLSTLSLLVVTTGFAVFLATSAESQIGHPKNNVALQPTTPGTSQSGHVNVSGTIRSTQLVGSGAGVTNVNAATLGGLPSSAFLQSVPVPLLLTGSTNGQLFRADNGAVGSGATAIYGLASGPSGVTWGVRGDTNSPSGSGVYAVASATSGTNYGGHFESSSQQGYGVFGSGGAVGIFGESFKTSGQSFGGFFQTPSTGGIAVYGAANALSGPTAAGWFQTSSPTGEGVHGWGRATTGLSVGVFGQSDSVSGMAVRGLSTATTGINYGGYFQSNSPNGRGLTGYVSATSGEVFGVEGITASVNGAGVVGFSHATTGFAPGGYFSSDSFTGRGVVGQATETTGPNYGVSGISSSTAGRGVNGLANSSTGSTTGVFGQSDSDSGRGVEGFASSGSGNSFGGYFTSNSLNGTGVFGRGTTYAVHGESGQFGVAVYGHNLNGLFGSGDGVYGQSDGNAARGVVGYVPSNTGTTYAVVGFHNSPSGYGLYAAGNTGASGTKSFRIDHPADPENKYLLHYSTESPKPQNFYLGNATTDAKGYAWVELPSYFAEINVNFKYQLTVVDESDSDEFIWAKVVKKISGNRFRIRTNLPNIEVSWRVDADRNDPYVREYPTKDIVEKEGRERGTYQHPELYGMPKERGMNFWSK